ncbi:MAG TPA: outer membrane beta-barrel protein [Pseudolabrys sp.]|nr:outer membrane beta-barrel protein [Pseudolabrys sp.]
MFWRCAAVAQTVAPPFQNPLPAQDNNGNQSNPPPFQRFRRQAPAEFGPPSSAFVPPANGAGDTGFDSTNARNKRRDTSQRPKAQSNIFAIEPPLQAPGGTPPRQTPPPASASGANASFAAAGQPGQPPVEIGPVRKPPKKRKSGEDDPYAPLGVRAGSFLLYPAIELIGGRDSNPGRVENGRGAWLYTLAPELLARSDWSRHELKAELRGSYTGYSPDETPTLSRPYFNGKIDGRIDVRHDTNINLGTRVLVSTDNPGSPNLQAGLAKLPVYTTFGGNAGLAHRFNRFELSANLDAERTEYQHSVLTDGTTASNKDRDYDQVGGTLRGSYELLPGVKPFVEAGADTRTHDLETDFSGFRRDSKGLVGKAGSSFELTRQLTGEIALGYLRRTYDDPRLPDLEGFIGQGSLTWAATALTSVKMTAASTAGESTIPGVSGILYRDLGLQVDHALRRWLIFTAKAGIGFDEYVGDIRRDKRFSLGAGLTYKFNREVQVKGEVQENWLHSNVSGNDYNATIFLLGLRLQR